MEVKGIIFDLDGVICHTDQYHYLAWKAIADALQIPFSRETNNRLRGVSRMESLAIILESANFFIDEKEKAVLANEKNRIYRDMLGNMVPADVSDEVREMLVMLKQQGYLLAIGSSSKNAHYILEHIHCTNYFDAICDGNDIMHSKPDPQVFALAGETLGLSPDHCVVVEDAVSGVVAAATAGMIPIAIGDAALSGECSLIISTLLELPQVIQRLLDGELAG